MSIVIGISPVITAETQDSYGYICTDSNEVNGPIYKWIEIENEGNVIPGGFDQFPNVVDIGFSFNYYGESFDQIGIYNCGILAFAPYAYLNLTSNSIEPITNSEEIHGFISPFFDCIVSRFDIQSFQFIDSVYYQTLGTAPNRTFVIEWVDVRYFDFTSLNQNFEDPTIGAGITFEAILNEESGDIVFQYKDALFLETAFSQHENGGAASIGIEDLSGIIGTSYSFREPVITDGLAIKFSYPLTVTSANMFVSINSPICVDEGQTITYTISYGNIGESPASDVVLTVSLDNELYPYSDTVISDGGIFSLDGNVTWNIGSVNGYPYGIGTRTVSLQVPESLPTGTIIETYAIISTSNPESVYTDNLMWTETSITPVDLPENIDIASSIPLTSDPVGTLIIPNRASTTFSYVDSLAMGVDINIHLSDGGPDIAGSMIGPSPTWTYTLTFGDRTGDAIATFTAHYAEAVDEIEVAHVEVVRVDPAGYIFDMNSLERISGATVWLQMPNGRGGWMNVPTGEIPAIADPDVNPQITGIDGRYQWDTLAGTYRVHVEASGYYAANSIVVTVPPPVTDLHVGLTKIPPPQDNSPPTIQEINAPEYPAEVNSIVSFSVAFTDVNILDSHSAVWIWSDGQISKGIITEKNGAGTVTGSHIFKGSGVYEVTLVISDNNGGSSEISVQEYTVIYDPEAGFVTGGGWINSPQGAYLVDPSLSGRANFGFVSKYEKGATVPTGNTEFQFQVAGLKFKSTSYDWLVIAGNTAIYKGEGTINGAGQYNFMLWADDGGSKGEDTFRIFITDASTDQAIYDNGVKQAILGGSILVHK
ncbi:MAG: post-COAP-1 domain-containing protein [Candidatus Bathyarchaeia archaeon]|jgi:uncharacterized repeat protein (TIGR01451 family)